MVGNYGVTVSAHNRLQRQFHSDIEMLTEKRLQTVDDVFAIELESVGDVVN
jgi:hypothetical protein